MRVLLAAGVCLALGAASPAWAKEGGCLKYGAAGAVAGHMVGKGHGVAGAVAGCAVGAHVRHKAEQHNNDNQQQQGNQSTQQQGH